MLFDLIRRIEAQWPTFNQSPLSSDDIFAWIDENGILALADQSIRYGRTRKVGGRFIIRYNQNLSESMKVLTLGHELGHIFCGHITDSNELSFTKSNLARSRSLEDDASIFGYLALIPTPELIVLVSNGLNTPEDLFADLQPLFDGNDTDAMRVCSKRIEIFNSLLSRCGGKCLKGEVCTGCKALQKKQLLPATQLETWQCRSVNSPFEVNPGEKYRFPRDPAHIIRLRWQHPAPDQQLSLLFRDVPVAGISFSEAKANATTFLSGRNQSLKLIRDPGNPYDPNAIKVLAVWQGTTGKTFEDQIGWVPKMTAAAIARRVGGQRPIYGTLKLLLRGSEGKNPGVRFDVWM